MGKGIDQIVEVSKKLTSEAFKYYLLFSLFKVQSSNTEIQATLDDLEYRLSFRLANKELHSPLMVLRMGFYGVKEALKSGGLEYPKTSEAILDGAEKTEAARRAYLRIFGIEGEPIFIARENILERTSFKPLLVPILQVLLLTPLLFLKAMIFPSYSGNWALSIKEYLECQALLTHLSKSKVEKIYHFSISERDANLLTLILRKKGIQNTKISSSSPFSFYNPFLLADRLIVNNYYQREECAHLKVQVQEGIDVWGPEKLPAYFDTYQEELPSPHKKTLGFYSNGVWMRKKLGDIDPGTGTFPSEEQFLKLLPQLLEKDPDIQLIIFPHPKEKGGMERFKRCEEFYMEKFGEGVNIAGPDEATPFHFHDVETAIGAFSNSLMERLYMGYKTFFYVEFFHNFPLKGSDMEKLCFSSKKELLDNGDTIFSDYYDPLQEECLKKYTFKGSNFPDLINS